MEEDEMEMTKEELQKWIREKVKIGLISPDVLEKCNLLQSLLERREKQVANFLKLCESVTACEATVKKLYSLLGWEYRDTDSDADHNITGCGNIPSSPCEFVHSETQVPSPPAANGPTPMSPKRQDSANLNGDNGKKSSPSLKRELVVVLTRLPKCEIAALRLPTPQNQYSEQESLNNLDTEIEWEPEDDPTDSDYSFSGFKSRANKRRKIESDPEDDRTDSNYSFSVFKSRTKKRRKNNEKPANSNSTKTSALQVSVSTMKSNATKTSTPQASANTTSNATKTSILQTSANAEAKKNSTKTSVLEASANTMKSNMTKSSTLQVGANTSKSNATKSSTLQVSANTLSNATKALILQTTANAEAKNNATKTSILQVSANTTKSNATKSSTLQASGNTLKNNATKTSILQVGANTTKSNATKSSTLQVSTNTLSNATKTLILQTTANAEAKNNTTKTSILQVGANTTKSNASKSSTLQVSANTMSNVTQTLILQTSANAEAKNNATKTSILQVSTNITKSNVTKSSTLQVSGNTTSANTTKNNATKTSILQTSANTDAKSTATKTSTLQASGNTTSADDKSNATMTSLPQASTNTDWESNTRGTSTPQSNSNINAKSNTTKTSPMPANNNATKVPPSVLQEKVTVGMTVLARRRAMNWQRGKIVEIVKRENGGLKYKIYFDEKGKSLVSGHHIAFHSMPKVDQLFVGARVVVKCQGDQAPFFPGVLAELPTRKNRMRFLVFLDNHTPAYVGLPLLHLVCRPLTDPLDDIPDVIHKKFMKGYLKDWPNLPQTQYSVGRIIHVELNGIQKKCEVLQVDCSLVQVVFQEAQHREWLYRGSIRLEHMLKMRAQLKKD